MRHRQMVGTDFAPLRRCHQEFFGVNTRHLKDSYDSIVVTCKAFHLSDKTFSLLARPPKFCPTPTQCSHSAIRLSVSDFLRKLKWRSFLPRRPNLSRFRTSSKRQPPPRCVAPAVRAICRKLKAAVNACLKDCSRCFPASNLCADEQAELRRLREDLSVTILPADKGGKWVIMPTSKYITEAERQLADRRQYLETTEDVDKTTKHRLTRLLRHLRNNNFLTAREFRALLPPQHYQPRRFYLLPKVHKPIWPDEEMPPGRPIVSDVNSVSRPCASLLEHFLSPIAQASPSYLRDSQHLLAILQDDFSLTPNSIFFTMDVNNLYNNIPIEEGLHIVSEAFLDHSDPRRPDATLLSMLRLLLTSNVFLFNNRQYLQLRGTPMGGAYSGSFANIYMTNWEKKAASYHLAPRLWVRYIDDIFGLWDHGPESLKEFHCFLNGLDTNIAVDLQHSSSSIRFLDLELYRANNNIGYRIGFKPTDCHTILPPSSHHPRHVFRGILHGQILRWATKSSSAQDFLRTKATVIPIWRSQGYTRTAILAAMKSVFKTTAQTTSNWTPGFFPCQPPCSACQRALPTKKIKDHLSSNVYHINHRLTCQDRNIIYCITCLLCNKRYIGQTSRQLQRRINEHLNDIRAKRPTPVSLHFQLCGLDNFVFTGLERAAHERHRLAKETAWMQRLHTTSPDGINTIQSQQDHTILVLPHSQCADRVATLCRRWADVTITCAKRRSQCLRQFLRHF